MPINEKPRRGRKPKPHQDVLVQTITRLHPRVRGQLEVMAQVQGMTLSAYLRVIAEERVCFSQADEETNARFKRIAAGEQVIHPKMTQVVQWPWIATGER